MDISCLKTYPVDGREARETGEFYKVTQDNMLHTVFGAENPILMSFYFSTEFLNFGIIEIPSGGLGPRHSEVLCHHGDALLYMIADEMTVQIVGTEDVFQMHNDEAVFIPAHTEYRCINYTANPVKAVFACCPSL